MTAETAVAKPDALPIATMEQVLVDGDLAKLTGAMRLTYYRRVCESLKLNPLTKPFDYIVLNGKLRLYANRTCSDQLRAQRGLSLQIVSRDFSEQTGLLSIVARATGPDGRFDESIAAIDIGRLTGEALANAMMKCETKAKRRVTLSYCGLGWSDESEVLSIPRAQPVAVNHETGEFIETTKVGSEAPHGNGGGGTRAAQSSGPAAGPQAPLKPVMPAAPAAPAAPVAAPAPATKPPPAKKPAPKQRTAVELKELAAYDEGVRDGTVLEGETPEQFLARMDAEEAERKAFLEQEREPIEPEPAPAPKPDKAALRHTVKRERGPDGRYPRGPEPDTDPWCPKCGGPMHDMRAHRKNPKAPEWVCQMAVVGHHDCEGVRWPKKADGSDHAAGA